MKLGGSRDSGMGGVGWHVFHPEYIMMFRGFMVSEGSCDPQSKQGI